eukprot:TRINITY_DN12164_c0_g1_i1.p1 TRINITY_DN12164_c0_g1~~TRINITY_DN12164_c0_g1_i1.p1  ORF type:complete len:590 (-),score=79.75 TRINITY_DN12164_c0_g1_i1:244-1965(-)
MFSVLTVILTATAATFLQPAAADGAYTDSAKSVNLSSALQVSWFKLVDKRLPALYDFHPVHGIETSDGSYVLVGKCGDNEDPGVSETREVNDGWAVKIDATGSTQWSWKTGRTGSDVSNAVVQLPSGDLLVAGVQTANQSGALFHQRTLTKLGLSDGAVAWNALFADSVGSGGAWEMVDVDKDGNVLLAGYSKNAMEVTADTKFEFKSYGNQEGGIATVMKLPLASVEAASPPSDAAASWIWTADSLGATWADNNNAKVARPLTKEPESNIVVQLHGAPTSAGLILLSSSGAVVWGPKSFDSTHGEATDAQPSADGKFVVLTGHGGYAGDTPPGLYARLTKVSASDGAFQWTKEYTSGGTPLLVYNECWGLTSLSDGYILACGTGIENCNAPRNTADCQAGYGDKRPGAFRRGGGNWQSLLIRVDLEGNLLWQRVDSYASPGAPAQNALTVDQQLGSPSSAAEWAFSTSDGGLGVVSDAGEDGSQFMKLVPAAVPPSPTPTTEPSPAPTAAPTAAPTPTPATAPTPVPTAAPMPSPTPTPATAPTPTLPSGETSHAGSLYDMSALLVAIVACS